MTKDAAADDEQGGGDVTDAQLDRLMLAVAHELSQQSRESNASAMERIAASVDGGLGSAAIAAIRARPRGVARRFEAEFWARRAVKQGLELVGVVVAPGADDDFVDAHSELMVALERVGDAPTPSEKA